MKHPIMENGYIRVSLSQGRAVEIAADPKGRSNYHATGLLHLAPIGLKPRESQRLLIDSPHTAMFKKTRMILGEDVFSGTDTEIYPDVPIYTWPDTARHLKPGDVAGQSFIADAPFHKAGVYVYAAGAMSDTSFRVTLRRAGPSGAVLATKEVKGADAPDFPTIWAFLQDRRWPAGRYFIEVSEPRGDIRWWCALTDVYPGGCAHMNGKPMPGQDFMFLTARHVEETVVRDCRVTLDGPVLHLEMLDDERERQASARQPHGCAMQPFKGSTALGFEVAAPWEPDGYGFSSRANIIFTRFTTDKDQYVPIEQFKRFPVAWPAYQSPRNRPAFAGARWLRAEGAGALDMRFSEYDETCPWPLTTSTMLMRFAGARLDIEFLPRQQEPRPNCPRFTCSNKRIEKIQNSFFCERSFGMGDGSAGGEWLEWIGRQSCWVGPPRVDRFRESLGRVKLSRDGYVWAMRYGGGYPHGMRYGMSARARRHYTTNTTFIVASWLYAMWTRDNNTARKLMPNLRRAMEFCLGSRDTQWLDGLMVITEPHHRGTPDSMPSTEYDCLPFGYKCAINNAMLYKALGAMAALEAMYGGQSASENLIRKRTELRESYNNHFWDDAAGRYIGCIDAEGRRWDFGFTSVNLLAMTAGLADKDQAARIYDWIENQPTATGKRDAYIFRAAPRANTLDIKGWWYLGGDKEWPGDIGFGLGFQNGGAFLFSSYYDILARLRFLGPDNAFKRYKEILQRYQMPDKLCGGNPLCRGEVDGYQVGVSVVFPEAGLAPNAFLYGFLGISPEPAGLMIRPRLPSRLERAGIHNLHYAGAIFDIEAENDGNSTMIRVRLISSSNRHSFRLSCSSGRIALTEGKTMETCCANTGIYLQRNDCIVSSAFEQLDARAKQLDF
ncbi:MAG: hypothetical protein WCK47_05240 [bacterium]